MKKALMKVAVAGLISPLFLAMAFMADSSVIDPDAYPEIGDQEMGHLRWMLSIADQEIGDFSNMETGAQAGMAAYRYQLAFMTYFLALEQYHKLPACPEIIQPRMDRFIEKMVQKPVWEFWAETSRGIPPFEPLLNRPYPEVRDPLVKWNIMYSGHLGHMIGLYEMLYRDFKWDQPGSIVFQWDENEKYVYDNHSLQKVMHDQMKTKPFCIPCEPNACFPECNQHPVLSFMLYDYTHDTDLSAVREQFMNFFLEKKMINPNNHEAAAFYLVKQDLTTSLRNPRFGNAMDLMTYPILIAGPLSVKSASADGWTGAFMHAWQPEYIERHYPYQKERHFKEMKDGSARLPQDIFSRPTRYGFFAILTSEVGDLDARDKLLAYSDRMYEPVMKDGTFHYPTDKSKKCHALTGKLLAIARANPKDGLWTMHNRPFDDSHFREPMVTGVDFPNVVLRRAIYDADKKALIVTTEPGMKKGGMTNIKVSRLDSDNTYRLLVDGKKVKTYRAREEALLQVALDGRHDIVLIAE
jgi:hypothetical protein